MKSFQNIIAVFGRLVVPNSPPIPHSSTGHKMAAESAAQRNALLSVSIRDSTSAQLGAHSSISLLYDRNYCASKHLIAVRRLMEYCPLFLSNTILHKTLSFYRKLCCRFRRLGVIRHVHFVSRANTNEIVK